MPTISEFEFDWGDEYAGKTIKQLKKELELQKQDFYINEDNLAAQRDFIKELEEYIENREKEKSK